MSYVQRLSVPIVTDAQGAATAYSESIGSGLLSQIRYVKDGSNGFDNGSTFAVTLEGAGETLWSQTAVNASATLAPRQATHATTGGAGTAVDKIAIANDRIKVVITGGGANKNGAFQFILE